MRDSARRFQRRGIPGSSRRPARNAGRVPRFLPDQLRAATAATRNRKMRQAKIPPVNSSAEVEEAFNRSRSRCQSVRHRTFRRLSWPHPSESRRLGRAPGESLLAESGRVRFDRIATRVDGRGVARTGLDSEERRGTWFPNSNAGVRAASGRFESVVGPARVSRHPFHRVQPGEVKSRHILIRPSMDSRTKLARARAAAARRSGAGCHAFTRAPNTTLASGGRRHLRAERDSMPASYHRLSRRSRATSSSFRVPVWGAPKVRRRAHGHEH